VWALNDNSRPPEAEEAKDYETAITTLNEAIRFDAPAIRSGTNWARVSQSAPKQATPRKNRSGMSGRTDYLKAFELRGASEQAQKDPEMAKKMALYNNLARRIPSRAD